MRADLPPGPGGALGIRRLFEARRDPLGLLRTLAREYGDVVHLKLAGLHVYVLNDPHDIEQVLVTCQHRFVKGRTLEGVREIFGEGLLTADGHAHERGKRLIAPAFHRAHLASAVRDAAAIAAARADSWPDGAPIDVAEEMSRLTLTAAARVAFGADAEAVAGETHELIGDAMALVDVLLLPFAGLTRVLRARRAAALRAARARLDRIVMAVIDARRAPGEDVLSLLLAAGEEVSRTDMCDHLITLLLAGRDTTAHALTWAFVLMAQHPGAAARVRSEAARLDGRVPVEADVSRMPATRGLLAEAMRLYPPAWLVARVAVEPHRVREYLVPAGALVVMSPWVVHRLAAHFTNPDTFDPGRWDAERPPSRHRFAYFPFGGGGRGCLGEGFAWAQAAAIIAAVAGRRRLTFDAGVLPPRPHPGLTLAPAGPVEMRATKT